MINSCRAKMNQDVLTSPSGSAQKTTKRISATKWSTPFCTTSMLMTCSVSCYRGGGGISLSRISSAIMGASHSQNGLATVVMSVKEVKDLDLDRDQLPVERVLGVQWCVQSETFKFKITFQDRPPTRRGILSTVSSFLILKESCDMGVWFSVSHSA